MHTKLPILNKLSTIWQPFFFQIKMHRKAIFHRFFFSLSSLRPVHTPSRLCMVAGLHMPFTCHFSNVMVFTFYYTWRDVCSYSQHQCTKLSIKILFHGRRKFNRIFFFKPPQSLFVFSNDVFIQWYGFLFTRFSPPPPSPSSPSPPLFVMKRNIKEHRT